MKEMRIMFLFDHLHFSYTPGGTEALKGIDCRIAVGSVVAVIGANASGKSTLAKHCNALLRPSAGAAIIAGLDSREARHGETIRRQVGIIFQNPDDQIVTPIVEEDVAFGLGNLGLSPAVIRERVDEALHMTGIYHLRQQPAHLLSGGEKQLAALAGILAPRPQAVVLDEATAMLDPVSRRSWFNLLLQIQQTHHLTVLFTTHHMDEAALAERVLVLDQGQIVMDGPPAEIFGQIEQLRRYGLSAPPIEELLYELELGGCPVSPGVYDVEACADMISRIVREKTAHV
jgi:energy-coupling factor transport system ATP-binding protein